MSCYCCRDKDSEDMVLIGDKKICKYCLPYFMDDKCFVCHQIPDEYRVIDDQMVCIDCFIVLNDKGDLNGKVC